MARKRAKAAVQPKRKRRPRCLRVHGLVPTAVRALWRLDRDRGKSVGALAVELQSNASETSRIVGRLALAGLVDRRRNPNDGRWKLVTLTEAGIAIKDKIVRASI
jgi:DNA-binding MarR family transcriptional regulator